MHAARVKAIREIRLDDIDLGNRRIVIAGTGPVSTGYFAAPTLRGTAVTLEKLRVDRQLLITAAEEQDPGAGTSTSGGHATGSRGTDAGAGR